MRRLRLWHILAVFALSAAWLSVVIPLGEGPDELPHYTVTRYIVRQGRLPDTPEEHEAFQPPLYYLLSAGLTFWINTDDFVIKANADYDARAPDAPKTLLLHTRAEAFPYRSWALAWHIMRLTSVVMGVVTIGAIYRTAHALTGDRSFALTAASLVAFLPGFVFMSSVVNNDNLAAMFAALLCWQLVALIQPPKSGSQPAPSNLRCLAVGGLLGLGMLSKTSMLVFIATTGITLVVAARTCPCPVPWLSRAAQGERGWQWRDLARAGVIVYATALLVSGWYFVRNLIVFGDWLAWSLVLSANAVRVQQLDSADWLGAVAQVYRGFWLEWIGVSLEPVVLWFLTAFALLAVGGAAFGVLDAAKHIRRAGWDASRAAFHASLCILALHLAAIFLSWIRWTQTVLGAEQARLFYPALTTLIIFLGLGLRSVHPRLPLALAVALFLLALVTPMRYFAPVYAPAPRLSALPPGAQAISATFKDKLRLIGWDVSATRLRPGAVLKVGLYWEALKDLTEDDWLKIQLLDSSDQFLMFKDGSPSAGRDATDSWRLGEKIASLHRLPIPADAPAGVYRLTVGVHPYGRKNWFPIAEENMWIALGDQLVLTEVMIE